MSSAEQLNTQITSIQKRYYNKDDIVPAIYGIYDILQIHLHIIRLPISKKEFFKYAYHIAPQFKIDANHWKHKMDNILHEFNRAYPKLTKLLGQIKKSKKSKRPTSTQVALKIINAFFKSTYEILVEDTGITIRQHGGADVPPPLSCPICMSEVEADGTACVHQGLVVQHPERFHTQCLIDWIEPNRTCPLCMLHVSQTDIDDIRDGEHTDNAYQLNRARTRLHRMNRMIRRFWDENGQIVIFCVVFAVVAGILYNYPIARCLLLILLAVLMALAALAALLDSDLDDPSDWTDDSIDFSSYVRQCTEIYS